MFKSGRIQMAVAPENLGMGCQTIFSLLARPSMQTNFLPAIRTNTYANQKWPHRILPTVRTEAGNPSNSIDFLLSLYFRLVRPETLPDSTYQIHSGSEVLQSGNADGEVALICNPVVLEYSTSIRGVLRCICEGKKLISLGAGDGTSSKGLLQSIFVLARDCPLRLLQLMYTSLLDASSHPHVSYGVGNQRVQCSATQIGIPYSVHTMALKGGSMACSQTEIGKLVMWKSLTNNKTVALVLLIQAILVVQASTMNTCPRLLFPAYYETPARNSMNGQSICWKM